MRLLNAQTLRLEEFFANVPPYTILSHCWETDEVTFEDVYNLSGSDESVRDKAGWQKIRQCCQQTLREGFRYAWVDTCCINKSSSAELSEAINSMFRWYHEAVVCFAYLADVSDISHESSFFGSRWFTRGWTLQELIAPIEVMFFDASWDLSTTRRLRANDFHQWIGVDAAILLGTRPLRSYSVAQRFSWAARRNTTRIEDQAYSLLGLFGVHMPLLYGEGANALHRLQEEVLRVEQDLSILAWSVPSHTGPIKIEGRILPLAPSLTFFTHCDSVVSALSSEQRAAESPDIVMTAHSVLLSTTIIRVPNLRGKPEKLAAVLNCRYAGDVTKFIAMEIHPVSQSPDEDLRRSSDILKVKCAQREFFLRRRLVMVDPVDVAKHGVTRTILIHRSPPWSEPKNNLGIDTVYSHLWLRFDNQMLNTNWKTQSVFPEQHWVSETRVFDIGAAFALKYEKKRLKVGALMWVRAAIVLSDTMNNQLVVYFRIQHALSYYETKIEFRLDHYHPDSYDPLHPNFEGAATRFYEEIQLQDGTWFMVRMRENLITDNCIAHLALVLRK